MHGALGVPTLPRVAPRCQTKKKHICTSHVRTMICSCYQIVTISNSNMNVVLNMTIDEVLYVCSRIRLVCSTNKIVLTKKNIHILHIFSPKSKLKNENNQNNYNWSRHFFVLINWYLFIHWLNISKEKYNVFNTFRDV